MTLNYCNVYEINNIVKDKTNYNIKLNKITTKNTRSIDIGSTTFLEIDKDVKMPQEYTLTLTIKFKDRTITTQYVKENK